LEFAVSIDKIAGDNTLPSPRLASRRRRGSAQRETLDGMGDVPSWLAAIGTVGAFAVALYLLGGQILDRRKEARDRRTAQARLVAAWVSETTPAGVTGGPNPTSLFDFVVLVRNGSDQPVYAVAVQLVLGERGTFVRKLGVLGPGETRELRITVPGLARGLSLTNMTFGDSAGQVWMRAGMGDLTHPRASAAMAILREDPGAYPSLSDHPTLALGNSLEAQQGKRVSYPQAAL
jgi:hypothetical protein